MLLLCPWKWTLSGRRRWQTQLFNRTCNAFGCGGCTGVEINLDLGNLGFSFLLFSGRPKPKLPFFDFFNSVGLHVDPCFPLPGWLFNPLLSILSRFLHFASDQFFISSSHFFLSFFNSSCCRGRDDGEKRQGLVRRRGSDFWAERRESAAQGSRKLIWGFYLRH